MKVSKNFAVSLSFRNSDQVDAMNEMSEYDQGGPGSSGLKKPFNQRILGWGISICMIAALLMMILPVSTRSRQASRRTQCKNNLKQIGLALHHYCDEWGAFPPPFTVDETGRPLHSWRTLLLPYLDEHELYSKVDLSQPWDAPVNSSARTTSVIIYRCPSQVVDSASTNYVAVVGEDYAFSPIELRSFKDFDNRGDGTLMVRELLRGGSIEWMKPDDSTAEEFLSINSKSDTVHIGVLHGVFSNGAVNAIVNETSREERQAKITIDARDEAGK